MLAHSLITPKPAEEKPFFLTERPIPIPGAGQVRLRVQACGVCHTDLHIAEGDIHPPQLPITPGHQVVGTVDALGAEVDGMQPGDLVGVPWLHSACGACDFCRRGEENLCPQARFTGYHVPGGFADYMLAEGRYVLPIPKGIDAVQAAPLLCAGIIGYRSLRKAELQPGERLGLIGFGASAHLALQVAREWGCEVYVFTRAETHRRHARQLGAAWAGGIEDGKQARLLDRAVIFAPAGNLIPLTLAKIRPGGTLAVNAIHMSPIPEMAYGLLYGERTLRSVANATYQDGVEFLDMAGRIPLTATVARYPFSAANQALLDLKHSKISGEAVLCMV
ncbi:MAG: zinc-dependent alcohol dehydrogenase family protein [Chloroflexota bacterium]